MKKQLIITTLFFATVSALPAQAGLLSLGSGLAASAGSSGFGTSSQASMDTSINTTGIEKTTGLKAHDNAALSGKIDADADSSITSSSGSSNPASAHGKHKGLLKSTVANELDTKTKVDAPVQANLSQDGTITTPGLSSHAETNAYGTYNR